MPPVGKTVIFKLVGTSMISVMPVPLLAAYPRGEFDKKVGDMNLLLSCSARLIRGLRINRFHKLSECVWSQLRECAVFMCRTELSSVLSSRNLCRSQRILSALDAIGFCCRSYFSPPFLYKQVPINTCTLTLDCFYPSCISNTGFVGY